MPETGRTCGKTPRPARHWTAARPTRSGGATACPGSRCRGWGPPNCSATPRSAARRLWRWKPRATPRRPSFTPGITHSATGWRQRRDPHRRGTAPRRRGRRRRAHHCPGRHRDLRPSGRLLAHRRARRPHRQPFPRPRRNSGLLSPAEQPGGPFSPADAPRTIRRWPLTPALDDG